MAARRFVLVAVALPLVMGVSAFLGDQDGYRFLANQGFSPGRFWLAKQYGVWLTATFIAAIIVVGLFSYFKS